MRRPFLGAMPRLFFHLHNSHGPLPDEEGQELARADARSQAVKEIRNLLAEEVLRGEVDLNGRIDVTTADGELVATVAFGEALRILPETGR